MAIRRIFSTGFLLLCASGLLAQATGTTSGDVRGRVMDQQGAALPGVVVTATNQDTGLARNDTSQADGSFTIRLLPPGLYRVSSEISGFQPVQLDGIRVTIGSTANFDLTLRLAGVAEAVTVRAGADLIDPSSTELSKTIDEQKIRNLPINQRNFLDFALTTPGVTVERGPQSGAGSTSAFDKRESPRTTTIVVDA